MYDMTDKISRYYALGPSEFLWLLAHAKAAFTDSFHGSVFSIIYEKPLYMFRREDANNYMFSRLETLLSKFKLTERIIDNSEQLWQRGWCDYGEVHKILKWEQDKLWTYLKKAMQSKS